MDTQETKLTPTAPIADTGCCPRFQPEAWDDKEITWLAKPFVKDHIHCILHVPLDMSHKVTKQMALIQAAGAQSNREPMLSKETSSWGTDLYIPVTKAVPGAVTEPLSGTFLTKVFEGPFRDAGDWVERMKVHVASKQRVLDTIFFGYTTCPKCAKAYGKNYLVLFAKLKDSTLRRAVEC